MKKSEKMNTNKTLNYITYQTFPADTANSLQTISNIKYLIKNNINVNLIFPLRDSSSNDSLEKINEYYGEKLYFNIKGITHNYPFGKLNFFKRLFFIFSHFMWSRKVVKEIEINNENSNFFTRSDWIFYFLSKRKVPVLFECHQYTKLRKYLISLSLKSEKSKIIFLNENLKNDYEKKYVLKNNFLVLHNGVDLEIFNNERQKRKQVVFVGKLTRFAEDRGLKFVIRSFMNLDKSYSLKIIGASNEEVEIYQNYVSKLNLENRVEILGYLNHEKVINHISESSIGVLINSNSNMHSIKYTSPLKYFEYLSADVKVVASEFDAHRKLPYSNNICFFNSDNPESFVSAIIESEKKPLLNAKDKEEISLDYRAKKIISLLD